MAPVCCHGWLVSAASSRMMDARPSCGSTSARRDPEERWLDVRTALQEAAYEMESDCMLRTSEAEGPTAILLSPGLRLPCLDDDRACRPCVERGALPFPAASFASLFHDRAWRSLFFLVVRWSPPFLQSDDRIVRLRSPEIVLPSRKFRSPNGRMVSCSQTGAWFLARIRCWPRM